MIPDQRDLLVFHHVAVTNSFTKAASRLAMSKGYISKAVSRLERQLENKLFQRSTRQLVLTDAGEQLLVTTTNMQAMLGDGLEALQVISDKPRGVIRIAAPPALAEAILAPVFTEFSRQYAGVVIELDLESRLVDPIAEGYDLVFRGARLAESNLIARKLGDIDSTLVATPKFLARHDKIKVPEDLSGIPCVAYGAYEKNAWIFRGEKKRVVVEIKPAIISNQLGFLKECVLSDGGVGLFPAFMVGKAVKEKQLVKVLPKWALRKTAVFLLYPSREHVPLKVRCLIDFLKAHEALLL